MILDCGLLFQVCGTIAATSCCNSLAPYIDRVANVFSKACYGQTKKQIVSETDGRTDF